MLRGASVAHIPGDWLCKITWDVYCVRLKPYLIEFSHASRLQFYLRQT